MVDYKYFDRRNTIGYHDVKQIVMENKFSKFKKFSSYVLADVTLGKVCLS